MTLRKVRGPSFRKAAESPKKGNEIQLTVRNKSGSHRLDVSIAEILSQEDAYLPYFHIGGSGISIYNIFWQIDGVILLDNGTLTERLGLTETELYPNGILVFDAQAEGGAGGLSSMRCRKTGTSTKRMKPF